MLPYYVEPEYWVEGYAEGDAKIVSATIAPSLSLTAETTFLLSAATTTAISSSSSAAVIRARGVSLTATALLAGNAVTERIRLISSAVSPSLSVSASDERVRTALSNITTALTANSAIHRARITSATTSFYATISANADYKWVPDGPTSETWTEDAFRKRRH